MQVSARADYALRALATLAAETAGGTDPRLVKGEVLATAQGLPFRFLENILLELRRAGLVASQRGAEGGYRLSRPATEITLADVIRVTDGPLAAVRGIRPEVVSYTGAATALGDVWIAVRSSLRTVLEAVTLADVVAGTLPPKVVELASHPEARIPH